MTSKKSSKQSEGQVVSPASGQRGCSITPSLLKVAGYKGWVLTVVKRPHKSELQYFSLFKGRVNIKSC